MEEKKVASINASSSKAGDMKEKVECRLDGDGKDLISLCCGILSKIFSDSNMDKEQIKVELKFVNELVKMNADMMRSGKAACTKRKVEVEEIVETDNSIIITKDINIEDGHAHYNFKVNSLSVEDALHMMTSGIATVIQNSDVDGVQLEMLCDNIWAEIVHKIKNDESQEVN